MAQQQSFLGTVRKQMHSVYTITRLLIVDHCTPITVWQFFLFDWLYFSSVMFLKAKTTVLFFPVATIEFRNNCTAYIQSLSKIRHITHYDVNMHQHESNVSTPKHMLQSSKISVKPIFYTGRNWCGKHRVKIRPHKKRTMFSVSARQFEPRTSNFFPASVCGKIGR